MIRTRCIAICEQTEAQCQGFACDDHIHKHCYTIQPDDAQNAIIDDLIKQINEKHDEALDEATTLWFEANPGETECTCEGEEFIGLIWIESQTYTGVANRQHADETTKVINNLQLTLQAIIAEG